MAPTTITAPIKNQRPQLSGRGQQHSCQPQNRSEHIGNGHGLLLVKAHIDEPVVDVSPVCRHGVLPLGNPPQKGEADVKDRDAQHQERHGKGNDGVGA